MNRILYSAIVLLGLLCAGSRGYSYSLGVFAGLPGGSIGLEYRDSGFLWGGYAGSLFGLQGERYTFSAQAGAWLNKNSPWQWGLHLAWGLLLFSDGNGSLGTVYRQSWGLGLQAGVFLSERWQLGVHLPLGGVSLDEQGRLQEFKIYYLDFLSAQPVLYLGYIL